MTAGCRAPLVWMMSTNSADSGLRVIVVRMMFVMVIVKMMAMLMVMLKGMVIVMVMLIVLVMLAMI